MRKFYSFATFEIFKLKHLSHRSVSISGHPCQNSGTDFLFLAIDDSLPTNTTGTELYCTSTQKKDQLWHSLVEKAYLKLKGGYGFTGS